MGDQVTHFKVGDRVLVQADWKHLRTPKSNGAFGYNFEGALQEYVVIDERCAVSPSGEEFLIHVTDGPSAAAVGLIEPWATVEGSYAWAERGHVQDGGRLLVVTDGEAAGIEALTAEHAPAEVVTVAPSELAGLEGQWFDDIVFYALIVWVGGLVLVSFGWTRGILFWRALTHWYGGMGVLVLCVAILPVLGVGGMQVYRAEMPGPFKDRLTPQIATTAKLLWGVYLLLTLVETLLLKGVGGMGCRRQQGGGGQQQAGDQGAAQSREIHRHGGLLF